MIDESNARQVQAKIICSIANIPITHPAEDLLFRNDVLVVPDFISNGGGVVVVLTDWLGSSAQDVFTSLDNLLAPLTRQTLLDAQRLGSNPRRLAIARATEKVLAAGRAKQSLSFEQFKAHIARKLGATG